MMIRMQSMTRRFLSTSVSSISKGGFKPQNARQANGLKEFLQNRKDSNLEEEITARIETRGPITVADFMNMALGHPLHGYYMRKDVFGKDGDFTTSPEISQAFGEMLGIWCVSSWHSMGRPEAFRLVELGPGRGTLMSDVLRTVGQFPDFCKALHNGGGICMVESSPALRRLQQHKLNCKFLSGATLPSMATKHKPNPNEATVHLDEEWYRAEAAGMLKLLCHIPKSDLPQSSTTIEWFKSFQDIPCTTPILVLAQELFDALPVYQFEFTESKVWREKLVDIIRDDEKDTSDDLKFRFVVSNVDTPARKVLLDDSLEFDDPPVAGDSIEIGAAGAALAQDIAKYLLAKGGACMIIDYGDNGAAADSLRGIRAHKFVHPLLYPGQVDLSADVNFKYLKFAIDQYIDNLRINKPEHSTTLSVFGPTTQGDMLRALGIETRVAALLGSTKNEKEQQKIFISFKRLVDSNVILQDGSNVPGMGTSYKALGMIAPIPESGVTAISSLAGFKDM